MAISEQQKAAMAAGRKKANDARAAAKAGRACAPAADPTPSTPEPAAPAPAAAPLVAARGGGFLPSTEEFDQMERFYTILAAAGTLPKDQKGTMFSQAQCLVAMLKGRELGLQPMEAVAGLYPTSDGTLGMRGDLMRSLVQRSGLGLIIPIETTEQTCRVKAIRYGIKGRADEESVFEYTLKDAQRAGFLGSDYWQRFPKGCLFAKATGDAARGVFGDILGGVAYVPEELITTQAQTTPKTRTLAPKPEPVAETPETPTDTVAAATPALPLTQAQDVVPAKGESQTAIPLQPALPRELTHSFPAQGANGEIVMVQTAGISRATMEAIMGLARTDPALLERAKRYIAEYEQPKLAYLTDGEGQALFLALQRDEADSMGTGDQAGVMEPEAPHTNGVLPDVLAELAREYSVDPAQLATFIAWSYEVPTVGHLTEAQLAKSVQEIRHVSRDTQALGLMIARAMG